MEGDTIYTIDTRSPDAVRELQLAERNERNLAAYRCRVLADRALLLPVEVSAARVNPSIPPHAPHLSTRKST